MSVAAPEGATGGVVVVNTGGLPEITMMAGSLARALLLREYITPIAVASGSELPWPARLLPDRPGAWARERLQRRTLPAAIDEPRLRCAGGGYELLFQLVKETRWRGRLQGPALRLRDVMVDRAAAGRLQPGDRACVTHYSAGLRTIRRAGRLGIPAFLEYPIAHHRFAEAILDEEARLQPAFAATLQFHVFPEQVRRRMEREIVESDYIFVLSEFQRATFVRCGVDEHKLITTPLGVDLDLFRPSPRTDDGIFRVMFTGQITQRKGISYLFEAFSALRAKDSELVLAGAVVGTDRPWRSRSRVRHVPAMSRWKLPAFLAEGDVYVLPSLVEGFPQTALEAMACAKPVIVSTNTFAGDVIEDGVDGFIVPIRDPDAIADRLRFLRDNPARRERMGAAARRKALQFSWDAYGQRAVEAIRLRQRAG